MAFTYVVKGRNSVGEFTETWGTWTNDLDSDLGGTIETGFKSIEFVTLQGVSTGTIFANAPTIRQTSFPIAGGGFQIYTSANNDGIWRALGRD